MTATQQHIKKMAADRKKQLETIAAINEKLAKINEVIARMSVKK